MKEEVFWSKVDKNGPVVREELGPCWLWTSHERRGYGYFPERQNGKAATVYAHRRAWELENGRKPEGILRHRCDISLCVKPSHLLEGTRLDNSRDMKERERGLALLSNDQVIELRKAAWSGENIGKYKKQYDVRISSITNAIRGKSHTHITDPAPFLGDLDFSKTREGLKLNQDQAIEIIAALEKPYWGQQKYLAEKYGVTRTVIRQIGLGTIYKHARRVYQESRTCA